MMNRRSRTILFRRDFRHFTGGHLKVWDYFRHAGHAEGIRREIYLTPGSDLVPGSPWLNLHPPPLPEWRPADADILFLAGFDWVAVPTSIDLPVINLIQGLRHADPWDPLREFLSRPATRICVSAEVAQAIEATGRVNGPVHVIPNGIDVGVPVPARPVRDIPVLIAGAKNATFAADLAGRLRAVGIGTECLCDILPREAFLALLARATVVVTLPRRREGFFLPALEAMALGAIVVCPDCIGNRGFCRDGHTAFMPAYEIEPVLASVQAALALTRPEADRILRAASITAAAHSMEAERASFLRILELI